MFNEEPYNEFEELREFHKKKKKEVKKVTLPFWLNLWVYVGLSVLGLGWLLRLVIFFKSVSANLFLRKVVLK